MFDQLGIFRHGELEGDILDRLIQARTFEFGRQSNLADGRLLVLRDLLLQLLGGIVEPAQDVVLIDPEHHLAVGAFDFDALAFFAVEHRAPQPGRLFGPLENWLKGLVQKQQRQLDRFAGQPLRQDARQDFILEQVVARSWAGAGRSSTWPGKSAIVAYSCLPSETTIAW